MSACPRTFPAPFTGQLNKGLGVRPAFPLLAMITGVLAGFPCLSSGLWCGPHGWAARPGAPGVLLRGQGPATRLAAEGGLPAQPSPTARGGPFVIHAACRPHLSDAGEGSRSVPGVGADISAWKPSLGPRMRDIRPWGETVPPRGSTSPLDPLPLTSQGKNTNLDIGVLATVSPSEKKRFLHSAFTQRRFPPFIGCLLLF